MHWEYFLIESAQFLGLRLNSRLIVTCDQINLGRAIIRSQMTASANDQSICKPGASIKTDWLLRLSAGASRIGEDRTCRGSRGITASPPPHSREACLKNSDFQVFETSNLFQWLATETRGTMRMRRHD
jgi:hypothetical protein